jgi:hypothetical protein
VAIPRLEIPPHSIAILQILLAVIVSQGLLFPQHLTVEQPYGGNHIDQKKPIGEHQELPQQDKPKGHINGIAAQSKNAGCNQLVGMVLVNAHAEALPERNQAQSEQEQSCSAKKTPTQETISE